MPKLFFSYCHVDEALRDRLEVHLSLMKNQGLIETWHDRGITAGSNLTAAIDENLESADVILLLVSADFLASWYCYSVEMKRALERHDMGMARVIPVILEPCDWYSAPFGKLLAVPKDGKAVTTWANQAEAWTDVVRQVRKAVEEVARANAAARASPAASQEPALGWGEGLSDLASSAGPGLASSESPRSSNLRLKKEFSDFDRDKFLHDSFEYMGKFFNASLEEVASRNPGIQVRFQPHGNEWFAAVIYREGKAVSECSVRVGGLGGRSQGLTFSYSINGAVHSFNEMLTVDADSQSMYFKALGMQHNRSVQDAQLSEQGASEYFWGMFIDRLQR
ncbi:toll/interleukin-1 receptor domain-containing protein [Janthinobacterium sp. SUN120]|uniref:toll/interleukin-1 receptor domain-containing protein n=1 Tax=Janthinobacterium sp. SUN120 TaxID=3004099 RepID=UPI0025AF158D|nr:toll/interleukin-1 receptor domain-containing protein [Janthinobacterium sp. SUN120]MDN2713662.1 toll/interleukin-1 receptor domain-containing protein [Janthinobacterium sp. SUN120]